ncbi:unnamed protein product, partial [Rotaria sp. Silwood2]
RDGSLLEGVAQHYFKQLITGMAYLHSLGVAHRDLKPENLLIANNDILKICDFGLSAFFRDRTTNEKQMLTTYCGTKPYISPEMLSKTPYHGEPVDIWSCGIILTAMLTGVFPWAEASDQIPEYKRWLDGDYNNSPWENIDSIIFNLLRVILIDNPTRRAKIVDIQNHQWLSKIYPKVAKLPLNVSTISNKRSIDNDESIENNKKKHNISKSTSIEKSTMRTVTTVVGKVPVDSECVSMLGNAHVYCENNDVFDCMLNQTNVGNNNKNFYLIQLLEENNCKTYYVWLRWGRVGCNGQNNLEHFGCDLDEAKRFFCQKFSDKTKNDFYYRHTFTKYPGKYDYVQLDYNPSTSEKVDENNKKRLVAIEQLKSLPAPESKLDKRIQKLIQLICNIQAMEEALLEMKFDARKNSLGKLSSTQIKAANNTYYTRIPHEFGRNTPPLIETIQQLKHEIELLETLDNIEIAFTTLNTDTTICLNPIDQYYEQLKCKLYPIEKHEDIYILIDKYLQSTYASTHQQYKMEIEHIFKVERDNENQAFKDVGNKMLLWHGSRLTNFAGIMSQGLRIAPPEAPVTGYMFGKGLYFADMSSKSANYCYPTPSNNTGLVLLTEVALGKCHELFHADNNGHRLSEGLSSVKGLGSIAPNLKNAVKW